MAINKKLISFATQAQFDIKLNAGDIDNRSIVFIEDKKRIWTHGVYFDTSWNYVGDKPSTFNPSAHTLGSHSDVTLASLANGDILKYNGSKWVNNTLAQAGIATPADIDTAIDGIEIGGRNLLFSIQKLTKDTGFGYAYLEPNTRYILSGHKGLVENMSTRFDLQIRLTPGTAIDSNQIIDYGWSNSFPATFTTPSTIISGTRYVVQLWNGGVGDAIADRPFLKLEKGTKATDWTPAPEDQVSDWNVTDVNSFAFLKNKPTQLSQFTDNIGVATHIANKANPHSVTKAQVGLGNVDNTSDANKPISTAVQTALNLKFDKTGGRLTTGTVDVNIELWRGTNASWNILNSRGYLRFQSNYTTVVGDYFDALKLDYNTGNALFKGNVTAPSFIGNINASSLNTGTVPNARITGTYTGLTNLTGTGNVDFARFIGNAGDTVAAPSITWTGDLTTGIYRPAAAQVAITTGGVQRALFNSSGVSFNGTTTVSGDINGTSATFSIKASGTDVFRMSGVNPVISTKSTGTIYLRPNGSSSTVDEVTISSAGIKVGATNVSLDGHIHSQYITAQRAITNTYTGSSQTTSVSQYGTNAMYNALLDGNANTLGTLSKESFLPFTIYSFATGCLVKTNIPQANNAMCIAYIKGYGYAGNTNTQVTFYSYANSSIRNASGIHYGDDIGPISVFVYDGVVCLWFKQKTGNESFQVTVNYTNATNTGNRVTSITNEAMPVAAERTVNIVPKQTALTTSTVSSALSLVNTGGTSISAGSATQPVYFSGGKPVAATAYASASVNYATSAGSATSATNATNATNTTNIDTLADNSSNAARFILFSDAATGNQRAKTNIGLKYNPSSNTITATLAGNASSATTAESLVPNLDANWTELWALSSTHRIGNNVTPLTSFYGVATKYIAPTRHLSFFGAGVENAWIGLHDGSAWFNGDVTAPTFIGALSGNASSATNADMLDGYHASSLLKDITTNYGTTITSANNYPIDLLSGIHRTHISNVEYASILTGYDYVGKYWQLRFRPSYDRNIYYRNSASTAWSVLAFTDSNITGNAATASKLGTATVGSTQLPIYLNAGTATAITRANLRIGLFGATAIGSTTQPIYIAANGVPTAITGSIANSTTGNAATATTATYLTRAGTSITTAPATNRLRTDTNISSSTAGIFPVSNNANAVITINRHSGNYDSQLGFSSDGNIYYRSFSNVALNTTQAWNKLYHTGNLANGTTAQYIRGDGSLAAYSDTVYTHPTTPGNKHIPSGGSTNQILRYSSSGTAVWSNENVGSTYTHPTGDGNKHVPATGTSNNGKVLKAGSTAGSISWGTLGYADVGAAASSHTHSQYVEFGMQGSTRIISGNNYVFSQGLSVSNTLNGSIITGNTISATGNISSGGQISATYGFFQTSDIRLKNIIKPLKININDILNIPSFYFKYKGKNEINIGTSAQEVQKVFPALVDKDSKGLLSVQYDKLGLVALEIIKTQQKKIDELENKINLLSSKLK